MTLQIGEVEVQIIRVFDRRMTTMRVDERIVCRSIYVSSIYCWYNLEQGLHCHDYIQHFKKLKCLDRLWRTTDRNGG